MSNEFVNVHSFDGTLGEHFSPSQSYTKEQKITLFTQLKSRLVNNIATRMIDICSQDLDTDKNIDTSNNIDSSDILAEICKKLENNSVIDLSFIEEQLIDISTLGPCPEGRTTRFLQIWQAIKDC